MNAEQGQEAALHEIVAALRETGSAVTSSLAQDTESITSDAESKVPHCPLCWVAERSVERWLRTFFAEFVNDPKVRLSFRRARGFCREHTPLLAHCGDALAVAILYADLADEARERWRTGVARRKGSSLIHWFALKEPVCPACAAETEAETRCVAALAQGLAQEHVWEALQSGGALCVRHVERVAAAAPLASAVRLLEIERKRMDVLHAELEEFIRKNDYRFRGEPWGPERDAWRRALARIRKP